VSGDYQSVSITTNFVSLIPVHGEVYLIQHYVIKVGVGRSMVFSGDRDCHDTCITKIFLKVVLNIISLTTGI
jgi:hypothetical protein